MKKIFSILSMFLMTFTVFGMTSVKAENTYKSYKVGEVIEAQVDKQGNKGKFIVIGDSPTTSDEVVVIQKNDGLNTAIKNRNIKYDSNNDFTIDSRDTGTIQDIKVTNAEIRSAITFNNAGAGIGTVNRFITQAPELFSGYIRVNEGHIFGLMTTEDYSKLVTKYGQDTVDKIFANDNYWLNDGAATEEELQFTDNDTYKINSANNSFEVYDTPDHISKKYSLPKYARVVNKQLQTTALTDLSVEYEPAIMITLCKTAIVVPNTPNPDTADMNVIMLSIIGILSLGIIVLSTKKIIKM